VENLWDSNFADTLEGDKFRNQLRGRAGDDALLGGGRGDRLRGGIGADELAGGRGNDREFGENGNDFLDQGRFKNGADVLSGGPGRRDTVDYSARTRRVRVTRDNRPNDGQRGEHDNVLRSIHRVRL
jgi:Ca2+-binding RTX toxin-like protein